MKTTVLYFIALFFSLISLGQVKYPPKVIVLFVGEKNTTFDESKFPNCNFYYTPGIKIKEKKAKVLFGKSTYDLEFSGTPEEFYHTKMVGDVYFFDKNGIISGRYKNFDYILTSRKRGLTGSPKSENYKVFSKGFVKKGKTTKKAKKQPRKPKFLWDYYGLQLPKDFEVEDASGKKASLQSLVTGNNLTLLYTIYLPPTTDLNKGMESGDKKKSLKFIKDALNTSKGIKALDLLSDFEGEFFGHRIVW